MGLSGEEKAWERSASGKQRSSQETSSTLTLDGSAARGGPDAPATSRAGDRAEPALLRAPDRHNEAETERRLPRGGGRRLRARDNGPLGDRRCGREPISSLPAGRRQAGPRLFRYCACAGRRLAAGSWSFARARERSSHEALRGWAAAAAGF